MKNVDLKELFERKQQSLSNMYYNTTHNGESGYYLEEKTKELLRGFIAQQYRVKSGFVVDINQNISNQIDIIVYQESVHPPLFDEINYFFRESIVLIGEVKASIEKKEFNYASNKMESVDNLEYSAGLLRVHRVETPVKSDVDGKDKFIKLLFGYKSDLSDETLKSHFNDSELDVCYIVKTKNDNAILMYKKEGEVVIENESPLFKLLFIINHLLITRINNTNPVSYMEWLDE